MNHNSRRRGAVLVMVLALIPVLALGAYSFTHWMRAESRASNVAMQQMQARLLAESGIERVRALLAQPVDPNSPLDLNDNPGQFAAQPVIQDEAGRTGMFTIIAPIDDGTYSNVRYGIIDESAKIPLHNKALQLTREGLMGLEGMTEEIADSILDWIDEDDDPRDYGAEVDYYLNLSQPYQPRNAVPTTLGELLLVKGVTPYLLYGEDANLDGILNPNEDDGDTNPPPDNQDGQLQRGWYPYLTLFSATVETNPDGDPKINIAGELSEEDTAKVAELFGEEFIVFLNAYKQENRNGLKALSQLIDATVEIDAPDEEGEGQNSDGPRDGGRGRSGDGGRGSDDQRSGDRENRNRKITLRSPWTSENVGEYLQSAMEQLTVSSEPVRVGVINVNLAPAAVLGVLPEMTPELAEEIAVAAKDRSLTETTPAWLLVDGLLELEQFRAIEPFITTAGKVYRVESVGFYQTQGPVFRIEAFLDATGSVPYLIRKRELASQGNAYPRELLLGMQNY